MKYEEEFTQWLYTQYSINNGDALIHYLEDGESIVFSFFFYDIFLAEMGLDDV